MVHRSTEVLLLTFGIHSQREQGEGASYRNELRVLSFRNYQQNLNNRPHSTNSDRLCVSIKEFSFQAKSFYIPCKCALYCRKKHVKNQVSQMNKLFFMIVL